MKMATWIALIQKSLGHCHAAALAYCEGGAPKRLSYFEARWDYVGSTDANPCVLIIRLCIVNLEAPSNLGIMAVLADPRMLLIDAVAIQCALALFRAFACLTVSLALGTLSV